MKGSEAHPVRQQGLKDDYYKRIESHIHRLVAREFRSATAIVDIGCGDCRLARLLAGNRDGRRVVGIDVSDGEFPRAGDTGERLRCVKADARSLSFLGTGDFDAALSVYSLHEIKPRVSCLREVRRLLRPGGTLLIVDFPKGSLAQRLWNEAYLTTTEVATILRRVGFVGVTATRTARRQLIWAKGYRPRRGELSR